MTKKPCPHFDGQISEVPYLTEAQGLHGDDRGSFQELWRRQRHQRPRQVDQINMSLSWQGVLRGLHWQVEPHALGKFVLCTQGQVQDVAVDLRRQSKTFGQWQEYLLEAGGRCVWVPAGFAHGFLVLSSTAHVVYLQDGSYDPAAERSLHYADPEVGIQWQLEGLEVQVSEKDRDAAGLRGRSVEDFFH